MEGELGVFKIIVGKTSEPLPYSERIWQAHLTPKRHHLWISLVSHRQSDRLMPRNNRATHLNQRD